MKKRRKIKKTRQTNRRRNRKSLTRNLTSKTKIKKLFPRKDRKLKRIAKKRKTKIMMTMKRKMMMTMKRKMTRKTRKKERSKQRMLRKVEITSCVHALQTLVQQYHLLVLWRVLCVVFLDKKEPEYTLFPGVKDCSRFNWRQSLMVEL